MKIVNQKKEVIRDQLFVVNKSAGRLRFLLLVLFLIIYWTIIAQTKIATLITTGDFYTILPEPTNFTTGIIRDMLRGYFSPSTILFIAIPVFLFLSSREIIGDYLNLLLPEMGLRESNRFLNNCAFSFSDYELFILKDTPLVSHISPEYLLYLGGPAIFSFEPSSVLIIQNIKNQDFFVITSDSESSLSEFHLSHGDRIYAVNLEKDRKVLLNNLKTHDKNKRSVVLNSIILQFNFNISCNNCRSSFPKKITMHEAEFLFHLGSVGKNSIHRFLYDETLDFLKNKIPILLDDDPIPHSVEKAFENLINVTSNKHQKNYAEFGPLITKKNCKAKRKHKHSRYTFLRKNNGEILSSQKMESNFNDLMSRLSNHLNNQLKSFFHISTIQLSIIEKGTMTINE